MVKFCDINTKEEILNNIKLSIEKFKDKNTFKKKKNTEYKKYRLISFDVETTGENNDFYLCGVLDYNEEYHLFWTIEETINYFKRIKHNDVILVATNLAFDFTVIFKNHPSFNRCDFIVNKGRFICITLDGTYTKTKMIDSLNFGGFSVEKMGSIMNIPKLETPNCLGRLLRNEEEVRELVHYNLRDCEVTFKFMKFLQELINDLGGELKMTISSTSMDIFTRRFLDREVLKEDLTTGVSVKEKIFKAYYGGRTEAFGRGYLEDYNVYDVNSLYPFMMLNDFPDPSSAEYVYDSGISYLDYEGVSYFELEIPYSMYPVLPFRSHKLIFPYGRIKGYYTHALIRYAIEVYGSGIVHGMCDTVFYKKTYPFFKSYIGTMYNKRMEHKSSGSFMEVFYKLLMNSLYGRFALKDIGRTSFFIADCEETILSQINNNPKDSIFKIVPGGISYFSNSESFDGNNSLPIWSVYVSTYAMIHMHKLISKYGSVYSDTDCIFTKETIPESNVLGGLKLENKISYGVIVKPKLYFLNDSHFRVKGVRLPKKKDERLFFKDSILKGSPVTYFKFMQLKESIIQKGVVNRVVDVEKHICLEDDKRDWNGEKFDSTRFVISKPLKVMEW